MTARIIAGTGHRPADLPKSFGYSFESEAWREVIEDIKNVLKKEAITGVISGMALGFDQALAIATLELQDEGVQIDLYAFCPCKGQETLWKESSIELYNKILARCKQVFYIQPTYTSGCMLERNIAMLECCDLLIAFYNGKNTGGTFHCITNAQERGIKIINLYK